MENLAERLYEDNFHAWALAQAQALLCLSRTRPNIDFPHLIEEVEDLSRAERNAVRSQIRRIIEYCLKLEYSSSTGPRPGWYDSIADARAEMEDKMTATIRQDLDGQLARSHERARAETEGALRRHGEADAAALLPATCPYLLNDCWLPDSRYGFRDVN